MKLTPTPEDTLASDIGIIIEIALECRHLGMNGLDMQDIITMCLVSEEPNGIMDAVRDERLAYFVDESQPIGEC
jgi:hypothetical protein